MVEVAIVVMAYVAGMTPSAVVMGRFRGTDPLSEGSGNPGATNVARTMGMRAGAVVALIDVAKGVVPTAVGYMIGGRELAAACWVAAVAGHIAPLGRLRHGGKGVATGGGGALVLYPGLGVLMLVVFVVVLAVTRTASLASIAICIGLVVGVALGDHPTWEVVVCAVVASAVIARHHRNIRDLFRGEDGAPAAAAADENRSAG